MNLKRLYIFVLTAICVGLLVSSCEKKRISYTEMIKRENREITAFFNTREIRTQSSFPTGLVTDENVFVKILEGVYVRVIEAGSTPAAEAGKTKISARFKVKSLSTRLTLDYDIYSEVSGGTDPLRFIFQTNRDLLTTDPQASEGEQQNNKFLCAAIQETLKYVGDGAVIEMVTSFREGPSLTAEQGVPLYFERIQYRYVK